jgi:membrane-associated phospholipid phosphatase
MVNINLIHRQLFADMVLRFKISVAVIFLSVAFHPQQAAAQIEHKRDSSNFGKWKRAMIAPLALTAAGLFTATDNDILDKYIVRDKRNALIPTFRTHVDDYMPLIPIAVVYGLNMAGVRGENRFVDRTVLLIKTEIINELLTFSLKQITAVQRPDHTSYNSFPSGHTSLAFTAATFMAKEYGQRSVWYSVGAYSVATGVGVLRVMNNRHWISDVFVGAGIGIFSAQVAYLTHQYKWRSKKHHLTLLPSFSQSGGGLYACYTFPNGPHH